MIDQLQSISIRLAEWSREIEEWQDKIPFDNPVGFKDYIFRRYTAGIAKLVDLIKDGKKIGFVAYEIHCSEKREFYVLATYVEDSGRDFSDFVRSITEDLARRYQCESIAFHTSRPGLIKKMSLQGFRVSEILMRKKVIY